MKPVEELDELKKYIQEVRLAAEGWDKDWKTLIATLLSARTRDDKTIPVCKDLFKKYNTIEKLANASVKDIEKKIKQINFYKTKSKNTLNCAKELVKLGKVPHNFEELIKLPGVGRKTANVFLAEQGIQAIGVDTHVARLSKKMGWTKSEKPEEIEEDLKKKFPKKRWRDINYILVKFGQTRRKEEDEIIENVKVL